MTEDEAIEVLWNYHHVNHSLRPADLVFVLGSNDARVAAWAACLYRQGLAERILFSGGAGRFTEGLASTEAERFAEVARANGVPGEAILIENRSSNTGENVQFSRRVLEEKGIYPAKILAVQKPYMERRTLATLEVQWPGIEVQVTSPPLSFGDYLTPELPRELVVSAMVGDFQRILEYPRQGFSSEQPVTNEAMEAFRVLIRAGFTSQLLKETVI